MSVTPNDADRPIIVTATLGPNDFAWADALRKKHFPPDRNVLAAHLTLFHHLPANCAAELFPLLADATDRPAPAAQLAGILDLGGGTAFLVESAELTSIRAAIAQAFAGRLTRQDEQLKRFHITVQNKVDSSTAQALQATLSQEFRPRPLELIGLSAWRYLGGPWTLLQEFPFRNPSPATEVH
ncbi:MAG: 2'-5' RNA ligase family protein [Pirellulales bacterium]